MGVIKRVIKALRPEVKKIRRADAIDKRHFTAAENHPDNAAQWAWARSDATFNQSVRLELDTLRKRVQHVINNNGFADGAADDVALDVVGPSGPNLQCKSANSKYNKLVESYWKNWYENPIDSTGQWDGVDVTQMIIREQFRTGEFLAAEINSRNAYKLQLLDSSRLRTPRDMIDSDTLYMGIEHAIGGPATRYWIQETMDGLTYKYKYQSYDAKNIIHLYRPKAVEQRRGIPWWSSVLQIMKDLHDYDDEVLNAMRLAARMAAVLQSASEDADTFENPEAFSLDFNNAAMTMPPGWTIEQLTPRQPAAQYREFRDERLREWGRASGMPLMHLKKDASGYNYSSARFDGQSYNKVIKKLQAWIGRRFMNRLYTTVLREGVLSGALPRPPRDLHHVWVWPSMPHVDPLKEAMADKVRLETQTTTRANVAAEHGDDYNEIVEQLEKEQELRKTHGVELEEAKPTNPTITGATGNGKHHINLDNISIDQVISEVLQND